MDLDRLHALITAAVCAAVLPLPLATATFFQALRLLHERWPIAGCAVTCLGATPVVVAVGRN